MYIKVYMRYFVHLAYDGSHYRGWQRQANTYPCIQDMVEKALKKVFKDHIPVVGCGRTDAGVHADQFYFHFDIDKEIDFDFIFRMNLNLPTDVRMFDLIPVHEKAHARYDATFRTYHYYLHHYEHPYLRNVSTHYPILNIDKGLMKTALQSLPGRLECNHLCLTPLKHNTTLCDISESNLTALSDGSRLKITLTANRFLKSMIRIVVARAIACAEGVITLEEFMSNESNENLIKYKKVAPPQGLHLSRITYPYLDLPTRSFDLII